MTTELKFVPYNRTAGSGNPMQSTNNSIKQSNELHAKATQLGGVKRKRTRHNQTKTRSKKRKVSRHNHKKSKRRQHTKKSRRTITTRRRIYNRYKKRGGGGPTTITAPTLSVGYKETGTGTSIQNTSDNLTALSLKNQVNSSYDTPKTTGGSCGSCNLTGFFGGGCGCMMKGGNGCPLCSGVVGGRRKK